MIKLFSLISTAHLFRNTQNLGSMESKNAHFLNCEYFLPLKIFAYPQQQKSTQIVYQSVKELTGRHPTRSISPTCYVSSASEVDHFTAFPPSVKPLFSSAALAPFTHSAQLPPAFLLRGGRRRILLHPRTVSSAPLSQAAKADPLTLTTRLKITTL